MLARYSGATYRISVSAFEFGVTANNVHDLCHAKTPGVPTMKTLGAHNKTTAEIVIKRADRIDEEWRKIQALRSTGPTANNATSSRRHAVYQMVTLLSRQLATVLTIAARVFDGSRGQQGSCSSTRSLHGHQAVWYVQQDHLC